MRLVAEPVLVNGDGSVRATINAFDDKGEHLGFTDKVTDLNSWHKRKRLAAALADGVECSDEVAKAAVKQMWREVQRNLGAVPKAVVPTRPQILIPDRQHRDRIGDSFSLLCKANEDEGVRFVQRRGLLYEIKADTELLNAQLQVLRVPALWGSLAARADWVDFKGRPAEIPRQMLEGVLHWTEPPLPELRGLTAAPLLLPSGEIITHPGFHAESGYFVTRGPMVGPVPDEPRSEDVQTAKAVIGKAIADFPFVGQSDRTHVIAAVMTRVVRSLIDGPTPLFDIEAPTEGTGKGLLAEVVSLIATGRHPRLMTEGRDEEEWRKRITSALVEAVPVTLVDNVRKRLESAQLSAVLTAREWSDRLLGVSRIVTLPVETLWLMTANNPAFSNEIARRIVRIRIDSGVERPWLRDGFRHSDLRRWVLEDRADLIHSLLVLVRAWQVAGMPGPEIRLGSFEAWSTVVGGILVAAGYEDFLGNRAEVYEESGRQLDEWRALCAAWWDTWRSEPVSVSELHALAAERGLLVSTRAGANRRSAETKMGLALADLRDRVIAEWRLRDCGLDPNPNDRRRKYSLAPRSVEENVFKRLQTSSQREDLEDLRGRFVGSSLMQETYPLDQLIGAEIDAEAAELAVEHSG